MPLYVLWGESLRMTTRLVSLRIFFGSCHLAKFLRLSCPIKKPNFLPGKRSFNSVSVFKVKYGGFSLFSKSDTESWGNNKRHIVRRVSKSQLVCFAFPSTGGGVGLGKTITCAFGNLCLQFEKQSRCPWCGGSNVPPKKI